ncbi:hypothetical protein EES45_08530 [Streptomyces sp. ADI97-07]|nr:hypothetical protein EES45_08530 [Streptomyces sp. ADI97-07]
MSAQLGEVLVGVGSLPSLDLLAQLRHDLPQIVQAVLAQVRRDRPAVPLVALRGPGVVLQGDLVAAVLAGQDHGGEVVAEVRAAGGGLRLGVVVLQARLPLGAGRRDGLDDVALADTGPGVLVDADPARGVRQDVTARVDLLGEAERAAVRAAGQRTVVAAGGPVVPADEGGRPRRIRRVR